MAVKTPTRGRDFIALHTRMLNDPDYLVLSRPTQLAWPLLLLLTADQGMGGRIPSDPRRVALALRVIDTQEATATLDELLEAGFIVMTDDPRYYAVRTWADNQPHLGEASASTGTRSTAGQLSRWHEAGKHTTAKPGCPLCEEATAVTPEPEEAAVAAPEQDQEAQPARTPKPGGMGEVLAELTEALDAAVTEVDTPFAAYREALDTVDAIAANPEVARRSRDARNSLRNHVLAHALRFYLGETATSGLIAASLRGAKTLGADGHLWYAMAAAEASGRMFETERSCIGWLKTVATRRAEQKGR